jgi:hypothetical protein
VDGGRGDAAPRRTVRLMSDLDIEAAAAKAQIPAEQLRSVVVSGGVPGAYRTNDRTWHIPEEALTAWLDDQQDPRHH